MTLLSFLLALGLCLLNYAIADDPEVYHNHAVWWVGNNTSPPDDPGIPILANGLATIINRCSNPIYVW